MVVRKVLLVILSLVLFAGAQTLNWSGMLDTARINTFKADSIKYTRGYPLSQYEDIRVILKANDTNVAGFKFDSVGIAFGYQTYSLCQDTGHSVVTYDTCFDQMVILDTLDTVAMLKCNTIGSSDSTGALQRNHRYADTIHCRGWAVASKNFLPEWDQYIRFFAKGITRNRVGGWVRCEFEIHRRNFVNVRTQ